MFVEPLQSVERFEKQCYTQWCFAFITVKCVCVLLWESCCVWTDKTYLLNTFLLFCNRKCCWEWSPSLNWEDIWWSIHGRWCTAGVVTWYLAIYLMTDKIGHFVGYCWSSSGAYYMHWYTPAPQEIIWHTTCGII